MRDGYGKLCKTCHNQQVRESKVKTSGGFRNYHLMRRYGISELEVRQMLDRQMGVCAICLAAPAGHVDHDHTSSEVRGMLCFNCNGGLGQFKDDPERLQRAIDYLKGARWHTLREASGVYLLCS
jgi:Recombination endonuclease VII